jgi:hypothetical protein
VFHQGFYIASVLFCVQFLLLPMLLDKDIGLSDALFAALNNRSDTKSKPILLHNRLVCGLRLLKRRANNGMCSSPAHLASMTPDCYGKTYLEGSVGDVDTCPFRGNCNETVATADLPECRSGKYIYTYKEIGEGLLKDKGFFETLPSNLSLAVRHLRMLKRDVWINKGTQFVRLDVTIFNSNTGTFVAIHV